MTNTALVPPITDEGQGSPTSGPVAEGDRLSALRRYDILDSAPDGVFERITALAARLFEVPISLVSLVDSDRIWLKSHYGIGADQIAREPGLCASAILQYEPLIVTNAKSDPRTRANPLVAGEFGLRFYAAVPITTHDGYNLGTLCVMGKAPRLVTEDEIKTLSDLACVVMDEIELRLSARRTARLEASLRRNAEKTARLDRLQQTLLTHMADGVIMQAPDGHIVASSDSAGQLLGLGDEEVNSAAAMESLRERLLAPDGSILDTADAPLGASGAEPATGDQVIGVRAETGETRWLSCNSSPAADPSGDVYVVTSMTDVSERHSIVLEEAAERRELRERIEGVLGNGALSMVFQPIVALGSAGVVGAEALARFAGPLVQSPDVWFAEAASVGLGTGLELAAIAAALARLDRLPPGVYLSVNASPATVLDPGLRALLAQVPPGRVTLELTDHSGVSDYDELGHSLTCLRNAGVSIAVEDTGAGFASLQHLVDVQPDVIKLDMALTRDIDTDPARLAMAAAVLTFGSAIDATVIAEGIETKAELTALRDLGVKFGQGYHFSKPAPLPLSIGLS